MADIIVDDSTGFAIINGKTYISYVGVRTLSSDKLFIYGQNSNDYLKAQENLSTLENLKDLLAETSENTDPFHGSKIASVMFGGGGDDYFLGSHIRDRLHGDDGNDEIRGNGGSDLLYGGLGNDKLYGGDGKDGLYGGSHDDSLYGNNQDDWLYGGHGADNLYGGAHNDNLSGDAGNDKLYGGSGTDKLNGGAGNDTLTGGSGADQFRFTGSGTFGNDIIKDFDFSEGDTIMFDRSDFGATEQEAFWNLAVWVSNFSVQDGDNVVLLGNNQSITIENFDLADLNVQMFEFFPSGPLEV